MTALALTFSLFAAWCLTGLGMLAAIRADTTELRVALAAPVLGAAGMILPLFLLSNAGVAMRDGGPPVVIAMLASSVALVLWRRPRVPFGVLPVAAICVANLFLIGRPLLRFGFRWISNANDDMANYVLSATLLLRHGLIAPLDIAGLSHDRDYASSMQVLHDAGARPGSDVMLSAVSAVTGRPPYELFMPVILALNLCAISAAGALAMQASRRWWAAAVAAVLLAVSPLATFSVLQQLMPQVWGLALAAALLAVLMRDELHASAIPRARDLAPVAVLAAALVMVYIELAATVAVVYGLYVLLLIGQRKISWRAVIRVWGIASVVLVAVLNTYLIREFHYLQTQTSGAVGNGATNALFLFTLVPAALPAIIGLQVLPTSSTALFLDDSIILSIVVLAAIAIASLVTARRHVAASIALVAYFALGVGLGVRTNAFGLFKLYMYIQPFLAAAAGVWFSRAARRWLVVTAGVFLIMLVGFGLTNQAVWVQRSIDPIDLRNASADDLLPVFRRVFHESRNPVVSVTENPTLAKLEAVSIGNRALYFISANIFQPLLNRYVGSASTILTPASHTAAQISSHDGWIARTFTYGSRGLRLSATFEDDVRASSMIAQNRCTIILPTGSQSPINRVLLPEGEADLSSGPCRNTKNLLVFTVSSLGEGYYNFGAGRVALYQLEPDYFYPGHTFAGLGRYVLFRALHPSRGVRLEVSLTATLNDDGSNLLPPASVIGASRVRLPLEGRGSARVFSQPLRPKMIGGQPYWLLDMGRNGRFPPAPRPGVQHLYGSVPGDPRYLTSYLRDVSLISDAAYRHLHAPPSLRHFPADLANPNLEYSGIYEDGWLAEDSYAVLAGGGAGELELRGSVLPSPNQRLEIRVNGRIVASRRVSAGALSLRIPVPASRVRRRIALRWANVAHLSPPDRRPAVAKLAFIGVLVRSVG